MDLKRQTTVLSCSGGWKFKIELKVGHDPSEVHRGESTLAPSLFPVVAGLGEMQLKEIFYPISEKNSTKVE